MIHGRISKIFIALAVTGASWAAQAVEQESVPGEFVVRVKSKGVLSAMNMQSLLGAEAVRPIVQNLNLFLVKRNILERKEFAIQTLSANSNILYAEPNYIYRINRTPNDPKLEELWGLTNTASKGGRAGIDIGASAAWDIETGSKNVLVAVIDTGIDYTHPDIMDNVWTNEAELNGVAGVDDDKNGFIDDIHGYDFSNNDGDPMDDHGHGTHVSGTIGAKGDDGKGIVGVNWNVKIMGVKFLSAEGSGSLEGAVKAINYATSMGAMIESNSWGGGAFTQALLDVIVQAKDKGVLFVAAAGNDSNNNDENPSYPATYAAENVVSVAAVDNSGQLAYFSNYGKKTVHVAAPGVEVLSSVPFKLYPEGYAAWSGTSMATPHISGIAALMKAHNPNLTFSEIKAALISGSKQLGSLRGKTVSEGLANAYYSLTGETPPVDLEDPYYWQKSDLTISSEHPYKENKSVTFNVNVPGVKNLSVYFEKFETESGYDFVEFFDSTNKSVGKWSGVHSGEFSPVVTGDTMKIVLTADDSVSTHGFDITKAAHR